MEPQLRTLATLPQRLQRRVEDLDGTVALRNDDVDTGFAFVVIGVMLACWFIYALGRD